LPITSLGFRGASGGAQPRRDRLPWALVDAMPAASLRPAPRVPLPPCAAQGSRVAPHGCGSRSSYAHARWSRPQHLQKLGRELVRARELDVAFVARRGRVVAHRRNDRLTVELEDATPLRGELLGALAPSLLRLLARALLGVLLREPMARLGGAAGAHAARS